MGDKKIWALALGASRGFGPRGLALARIIIVFIPFWQDYRHFYSNTILADS